MRQTLLIIVAVALEGCGTVPKGADATTGSTEELLAACYLVEDEE